MCSSPRRSRPVLRTGGSDGNLAGRIRSGTERAEKPSHFAPPRGRERTRKGIAYNQIIDLHSASGKRVVFRRHGGVKKQPGIGHSTETNPT